MNLSSTNSFSLIRGFKQVGFFTAISRILGLVRDVLLALVLGAGAASDAFLVALKLPNFFRRITAEGALTNVFLLVCHITGLEKLDHDPNGWPCRCQISIAIQRPTCT